jgi:hypothetical protein
MVDLLLQTEFVRHLQSLDYADRPNYAYLRALLRSLEEGLSFRACPFPLCRSLMRLALGEKECKYTVSDFPLPEPVVVSKSSTSSSTPKVRTPDDIKKAGEAIVASLREHHRHLSHYYSFSSTNSSDSSISLDLSSLKHRIDSLSVVCLLFFFFINCSPLVSFLHFLPFT